MSEALAAALGYRTHAALLSQLPLSVGEPDYILLDDEAFDAKLSVLGHGPMLDFSFGELTLPGLLNTTCSKGWSIEYKSPRDKAWRNAIVCGVNEGLRRRLFSLHEDGNSWPGWTGLRDGSSVRSIKFDLCLSNGVASSAFRRR